jgi:hypothetical protein
VNSARRAVETLGDAILARLEAGVSDAPSKRFHSGQPVPTFTMGTAGGWKIDAPGVAAVHAYGRFDGQRLLVATADPDRPALLDGRPVPETWLELRAPCVLAIGSARIAIDARTSSEFPAVQARVAGPVQADAATRIDIEPLWADEKPAASDPIAPELPARRAPPRRHARALLLALGAALTIAGAHRFVAWRRTMSPPDPIAEEVAAQPPAARPPAPVASSPAVEPSVSPRAARAPVGPALPMAPTSSAKTPERDAVDALTAGDFAKASRLYRALADAHPDQPAFKEALRILEERSRSR